MAKTVAVSIRLDEHVKTRLEKLSRRVGLDKTTLIRMAVEALLADVERRGSKLVLPIEFEPAQSSLGARPGRSHLDPYALNEPATAPPKKPPSPSPKK